MSRLINIGADQTARIHACSHAIKSDFLSRVIIVLPNPSPYYYDIKYAGNNDSFPFWLHIRPNNDVFNTAFGVM